MQTFWEWYFPPYLIGTLITFLVGLATYLINYPASYTSEANWKRYGARILISFPIWPLALVALFVAFIPKVIKDAA